MKLLETIASAWGWKGLVPTVVVDCNAFGNVVVIDEKGQYWRICPEEASCEVIAAGKDEYLRILTDPEFTDDWAMHQLRQAALNALGPVPTGSCYCLKVPAVLGGEYSPENLSTIELNELVSLSGSIAQQIDGLPNGATVKIEITD